MATVQPSQAPSMDQQAAMAEQEQAANQITGIPEVDAALIELMKVVPKQAAPQLEGLVQALENTMNQAASAQQQMAAPAQGTPAAQGAM